MKFAWKVTLAALCILLLSTGVGSYLLISLSFQSALEREIDMAQEEMQMLRVSYEAVCDARGITLENVAERGRSLERTLKEAAYFSDRQFRITTPMGSHIYSTLDSASDQELLSQIGRRSSGYVLRHEEKTGRYLLHCAGPVALPDGILYMETIHQPPVQRPGDPLPGLPLDHPAGGRRQQLGDVRPLLLADDPHPLPGPGGHPAGPGGLFPPGAGHGGR